MATKQVKGVIVPRHDTAINWSKAVNFVPKKGELIVYDIDTETYDTSVIVGNYECSIKSSDKVRFKFGDGDSNVNVLPFATTENSGGGEGGFTEEEIIELIKEHSESTAIVYVDTQEHIGRTLELQDVYPIQSSDTKLQVISKNRIKYDEIITVVGGVEIYVNSNDGVRVTNSAIDTAYGYVPVGTIDVSTPGKYTISVDNSGVNTSDKKCYITYSLIDTNDVKVISQTKLTSESPIVIDTRELNCNRIEIELYIGVKLGASFKTSATQTFKVQAEYGEVATPYTPPKDETNIGNKTINIYGRNLFNYDISSISCDGDVTINGNKVTGGTEKGIHYVKGEMTEDNNISINSEYFEDGIIHTPLLKGDKFTFIYTYTSDNTLANIQIIYGHTDYAEYESCEISTTISNADGSCDISNIKYPYSFLALEDVAANEGYAIYLQYDPALSRNWTERQLENIDKRLGVDFIVEQVIQDDVYYEKWNSGIIKYFTKKYVPVTNPSVSGGQFEFQISIPTNICSSILTYNLTAECSVSMNVSCHTIQQDGAKEYNMMILIVKYDTDKLSGCTIHLSLIGKWK